MMRTLRLDAIRDTFHRAKDYLFGALHPEFPAARDAKHASPEELKRLWEKARRGDVLALESPYVATARNGAGETPLHLLSQAYPREDERCRECGKPSERDDAAARRIERILKHPEVGTVHDGNGRTPLHELAERGCAGVFWHSDASRARDQYGSRPLSHLRTGDMNIYEGIRVFEKNRRREACPPLHLEELFRLAIADAPRRTTPIGEKELEGFAVALRHAEVGEPCGELGFSALHCLAGHQYAEILKHPQVATSQNWRGATPMHILAFPAVFGFIFNNMLTWEESELRSEKKFKMSDPPYEDAKPEVVEALLAHPDVAKTTDWRGWTPLHWLSYRKAEAAKSHPEFTKVTDWKGRTPEFMWGRFAFE